MIKQFLIFVFTITLSLGLSFPINSVQRSYYGDGTTVIYDDNSSQDIRNPYENDGYNDAAPLNQIQDTQSYLRRFSPAMPEEAEDGPKSIYMQDAYQYN